MTPSEVSLAPLHATHAPAIVRWLRDPDVGANLGLRAAPTLARTRSFIAAARRGRGIAARAILCDGRHVGNVVLDHIDRRVGKARLHVYIGDPAARGRHVGRRAVALAVALAFEQLDLHKVWLTVHARNTAAIRAYQAVGFVIEGTHRAEFQLAGSLVDELYMGVLRTDPPVV